MKRHLCRYAQEKTKWLSASRFKKTGNILQALLIYSWLIVLSPLAGETGWCSPYYSVYLLCGTAGIVCTVRNAENGLKESKARIPLAVCAILFSTSVLLANYTVFEQENKMAGVRAAVFCFLGGFCTAHSILAYLLEQWPLRVSDDERNHGIRFFILTFAVISCFYFVYFFTSAYPGILTRDSFGSIREFLHGSYTNLNPFWYTLTIEVFFRLGVLLWGEYNAGVALFISMQILFMAACIAYLAVTLYQIKLPKWVVTCVILVYMLLPYHIVYSATMWKDVLFSTGALLMTVALYRILRGIGKSERLNYIFFFIGGLGFSVWRTNGWHVFLVSVLLSCWFLRKNNKKLLVWMIILLIIGGIMTGPLLDSLHISGGLITEMMSIPLQQIGRVIYHDGYFMPEERELLSQVLDLELVKEGYLPYLADPIKWFAFKHENTEYFLEHIGEYIRIWLRVARRYPAEYIKAWVEQTKGYWNAGYQYTVYTSGIIENELGIVSSGGGNWLNRAFDSYFQLLGESKIAQPFYSIGLHVWMLFACCFVNFIRKRKELLLAIPFVVILLGLWIGTPVFAEFRYAYPIFLTLPLIVCTTMYPGETETI